MFPIPRSLFPVPRSPVIAAANAAGDDVLEEAAADERKEELRFAPREEEQAFDKQNAIPPAFWRGEDRAKGQREEEIDK